MIVTANRFRPVLLVAVVGVVLAGCGDEEPSGVADSSSVPRTSEQSTQSIETQPSTPPPTSTTPTTEQPGAGSKERCTAAALSGVVRPSDAAAGNRYAKLMVTNDGTSACTLYGYGGFQLIGTDGEPLPTETARDEAPKPTLVRLAPGASAAKNLHWGVVPTGDEPVDGPCQPEAVSAEVIPPDETEPFTVDWSFGPVCADGTMHDSAYYQP